MQNQPLRHPRKLRMVTIRGGISVMNLEYMIQRENKMDDAVECVIYEANYTLREPCDVPAHIYTFPFEPNPNWSAFYAGGQGIHDCSMRTAKEYNPYHDVKTSHRIVHAQFDEYDGIWNLKVQHKDQVFDDWCNILKWPDIKGLHDFKGLKVHSAVWNEEYDYSGKKIAIVGNGGSVIQIMPELAMNAKHVTKFIRNPTWITPGSSSVVIDGKVNKMYLEEEKRRFREEPEELKRHRKEIQYGRNKAFATVSLHKLMNRNVDQSPPIRKRLPGPKSTLQSNVANNAQPARQQKDLAAKLTSDWEVGCRRATTGPGYLETFTQPNASPFTTSTFSHHSCRYHDNRWNAPRLRHHRLPDRCDTTMCQWIPKIATEDIKYNVPTSEATEYFNTYGDEFMDRLVWTGGCRSWYKNNRVDGWVTAVWQESAIGYKECLDGLRPEDFRTMWTRNRFKWLGNGKTRIEGETGSPEAANSVQDREREHGLQAELAPSSRARTHLQLIVQSL
ncbi:hypothetical protein K469DRAFT_736803 [Zopfia rhizophila CBS 207.26]|uniref:FAD/NAD(P)-binding domain-containing protein n=1 Tax=Zopfia rhizophila CBS 207.26 TaxID=1314779 RepID=A0A6A6EHW1_9PEZI|nr:hypothetical protein K469DRAFT_736803 [Zopfia rhizophila CBS 207.26]